MCCSGNQEGAGFDFGELEEAFVLQGFKMSNDEAKACMVFFFFFLTFAMYNQLITVKQRSKGCLNKSIERFIKRLTISNIVIILVQKT